MCCREKESYAGGLKENNLFYLKSKMMLLKQGRVRGKNGTEMLVHLKKVSAAGPHLPTQSNIGASLLKMQ